MKVATSYRSLWGALRRYWTDYGGWREFLTSPLVHVSALLAATSYSVWSHGDWTDMPLSLLPNLLGFSLGAYALIFSLASENLLAALNRTSTDGSPPLLRMINATFLHFILVQTAAITFALANKASFVIDLVNWLPLHDDVAQVVEWALCLTAAAVGYWLTTYAVVLLVAAAIAAYRLANMSGKAAALSASRPPTAPPYNP